MALIPQVRRVTFNDEEIGMGFDSATGFAVGSALQDFTIQENPVAAGQEVSASITIVNSHEELQERIGMSFEAQGRYGIYSGSAKARFSEQTNYNSTSTFLVASVVVENPLRRGKGFRVTEQAKALLDSNRLDEFKTAFGDSFVRGLQTGGEFSSVIRITSVSMSKQTELAASLQAEANGLVASGSFKAEFTEANAESHTKSEFVAVMYQKAGSGAEISPTVEIAEVVKRFKEFPVIAKASAAAYETEVVTYDTLPLPLPTPEEQEDFLFALADAREKKLRYIQTRNDLEFALRNPSFFEQKPEAGLLTASIDTYTKLINAVMTHAISLARGQLVPPQIFDPMSLPTPIPEPAPVKLERVKVELPKPAANTMPNLVGRLANPFTSLLACVQLDDVDHCLAFVANAAKELGPEARQLAEFIFVVSRTHVEFKILGNPNPPESRILAQFPPAGVAVVPGAVIILTVSN